MSEANKVPVLIESGKVQVGSIEQAWRLAQIIIAGGFAPRGVDKPEQATAAIMYGLELGLSPIQAVQGIAIINGRPALWGDHLKALVLSSPQCEYVHESIEGEGENMVAICRSKRKDAPTAHETRFSWADAKRAGFAGKDTYKSYPQRMLQMRARSWNLRDNFADVLRGTRVVEEENDYAASRGAPTVTEAPRPRLSERMSIIDADTVISLPESSGPVVEEPLL